MVSLALYFYMTSFASSGKEKKNVRSDVRNRFQWAGESETL